MAAIRPCLAAVITVVLLLSVGSAAVAAPPTESSTQSRFADVRPGSQFFDEIEWLAANGISTGWTEADGRRTYRPLFPVQRDAMAVFMYRLAGSPVVNLPARSPFRDVTPSTQYYKEMVWLYQQGISTGWVESEGTRSYRPLQAVGRDAMAAFMYRYAGIQGYRQPSTPLFSDISPSVQFYKEMSWLRDRGISTGYSDGTFRPSQSVNRDAMAAFMYRLANLDSGEKNTSFGGGLRRVGVDIAAGTYRAVASDYCYWERLSGFGGSFDEVITNKVSSDTTIVTIGPNDAGFVSQGCGVWQPIEETYPSWPAASFGDGHYRVGKHIDVGTYRAAPAYLCYWERQSGFGGGQSAVISSGLQDGGQVTVTISASDVGFLAQGCGTWRRV